MKKMTLALTAMTLGLSGIASAPAFANEEGVSEYNKRQMVYQGNTAPSNVDYMVVNNAEGVDAYKLTSLQNITPAAGTVTESNTGLNQHISQKRYNGDF